MSQQAKKADLDIPILIAESCYSDLSDMKRSFAHLFLNNVTSTGRAYRAIDLARRKKFEIIFISDPLVHLDGLSVIHAIRKEGKNTSTPIIFVSEYPGDPGAEKAEILGADKVISKPIVQESLRSVLEDILDIPLITDTEEKDRIREAMKEARIAVEAGRKLRLEGDYELAEEAFRKALAEVFCGLAEVYLSKGDRNGAEEVLKEAEKIDSESRRNFQVREKSFVEQGKMWMQKKQFVGAKAEFQAALTLNESNVTALLGLGEAHYCLNELEKGEKSFMHAMEFNSPAVDSKIFRQMGMTACRSKHFALAHRALDRGMKKFPADAGVYYCKAVVLVAEGDMEDSLKYLRKSLELEPGFGEAAILRDKVKMWMEKGKRAQKEMELEMSPVSLEDLT